MNVNEAIQSALKNYQAGNLQEAENIFKEILEVQSNNITAINLLGTINYQLKNYDSAIQYMKKLINLTPNNAQAYYVLGHSMQEKDQLDEAITYYQKALQVNPNFPDVYYNLGSIFQDNKRYDEAIICYQKALQMDPTDVDAYYNLGLVLQEKEQLDEAVTCYQKALEINPDLADAYSMLTYQMQRMCNWQELASMSAKLDSLTRKALADGTKPAETPFMNISRNADPSVNFAIAESWSRDIARAMSNFKNHFSFDTKRTDKMKIVIGYLSDDFRNHATAHLMLSLFGLHNRDGFRIYCYSYGEDDGSYYRKRIRHDCDKFVDIAGLSYNAAARCIYEDQVDILIDLKGYTKGNKLEICALRPAPIQVSYLGFPGTTGGEFFDYIISDKIVTPEDHTPYYSEKFVYMPHCYQVNDHTQTISNKNWKKVDFGLPESCFVFSSFNQPYKIDPVIFGSWMRILQRVPEGILWLIFENKIVEENLRREAEARGVKPERLIFATFLPKDEHLARQRFADLALDTRIYNGHTTTSDALWAGAPVITLQGTHFASRVSASILSAMWLPELITNSSEEYESLAVRLAHNTAELQEIRRKIARNRLLAPLFDTPRFVKNIETAYKEMWKIFSSGEAPRQIEVI
jgi:protein O-GlcNAc transferase